VKRLVLMRLVYYLVERLVPAVFGKGVSTEGKKRFVRLLLEG
jgi:hypothetical protein